MVRRGVLPLCVMALALVAASAANAQSALIQERADFSIYKAQADACTASVHAAASSPDRVTEQGKANVASQLTQAAACLRPHMEQLDRTLSKYTPGSIWDGLVDLGYGVVAKTEISNLYAGCGSWASVGMLFMEDGDAFQCDRDSPSSSYSMTNAVEHARATLFKNATSGQSVLLVGNVAYDGKLVGRSH